MAVSDQIGIKVIKAADRIDGLSLEDQFALTKPIQLEPVKRAPHV